MSFKKIALLIITSILLSNCAHLRKPTFIQNRDTHYLTAKSIAPLRIPPGLTSDQFQNYYPIPDRNYPRTSKNVSIEPPGLYD